jgi:DNA-binding FadR family transcriptional regulator
MPESFMPDSPMAAVDASAEARAPKLAQQVAVRIEQDIIRLGWPVGHNLGSEADMATRYGVGRWVLREAISIAASDGVLEIQRGRYGGMFVAAPAARAVVVAIHNYLEFCQVAPAALLDARLELESLALRLAAECIDAGAAAALRELASAVEANDEMALQPGLMRAALQASGNRVIDVFVQALLEATRNVIRRQYLPAASMARRRQQLTQLRCGQIEALIAGDSHRIHALQIDYINCWRELLASPASQRHPRAAGQVHTRRAEALTQGLLEKISALHWAQGHGLGSEAELMAEFGVSRAVLREAIRPLERHGVVEMRPGRGEQSGLRIGTPDPAPTVRTAALFLKHSRVPLSDIFDVQEVLEMAAVAAAASLAAPLRADLGAVLSAAASGPAPANALELDRYMRNVYLRLGHHCGNPVYGLLMHILAAMAGPDEQAPQPLDAGQVAASRATCVRMAAALRDGDVGMSRRHMLDWRRVALAMSPRERSLEQIVARDPEAPPA